MQHFTAYRYPEPYPDGPDGPPYPTFIAAGPYPTAELARRAAPIDRLTLDVARIARPSARWMIASVRDDLGPQVAARAILPPARLDELEPDDDEL